MLSLDMSLVLGGHSLSAKADIPLSGITALEGVSGSGKTTLLRMIAGLEPRARGRITFADQEWQSERAFVQPQARRIGFVFQETRLFRHLDVARNLAYGHQRAGAPEGVLQQVIEALDLSDILRRRVGGLSGGEKQRVAIGRALAMKPQLLLLDEPMSGLDRQRKDEILAYIALAVRTTGCPAIYVSHERRETSMLADRLISISDGKLTGPVPCETRFNGEIRPAGNGQGSAVWIGDQETAVPPCGTSGRCVIRFNEQGVVLARSDPGNSTALIRLPAQVADITEDRTDSCSVVLKGDSWRVVLRRTPSECRALELTRGDRLWLLISDALAGPEG